MERILTAPEAAKRLGTARQTLARYIDREIVKPDFESSVGGFFRESSLDAVKQVIEAHRGKHWVKNRRMSW